MADNGWHGVLPWFYAIPKGKRYALFPGKPFLAFPELLQVMPTVDIARLMLRSTCASQ
jgi:hypothetical protein